MKLDAEALRRGLLLDAIPIRFAIEWADRRVEETDRPHPSLLDTAMAVDRAPCEVANCLAQVPGKVESHKVLVDRIFAWMHEVLLADPTRASTLCRSLLEMVFNDDLEGLPERDEIYRIDDAFERSAPGGFGDPAEAERQIGAFLARFAVEGLRGKSAS